VTGCSHSQFIISKEHVMNQFGGDWTRLKIEILVEYAKAYLTIMNKYTYFRILYFDGFAGTGFIINDKAEYHEITAGAARRIVEIDEPKSFDGYYFVEKDKDKAGLLTENTKKAFPGKQDSIFIAEEDCNNKLKALAQYLKEPKNIRNYDKVLAYIDPCGMQLEWNSINVLQGAGVDIWILIPTGMGVNRLLKRNGDISDAWIDRLIRFLGLSENEIRKFFFKEETELTLFGEQTKITKTERAIEKAAILYKDRLKEVFKYVTDPFPLRNKTNSTMYHLIFASNNVTARNIATDIITKYS